VYHPPPFLIPTAQGHVELPDLDGRAIEQCSLHAAQLERMMDAEHGTAFDPVIRFGEATVHELCRFSRFTADGFVIVSP
jgi:hypothetical protein